MTHVSGTHFLFSLSVTTFVPRNNKAFGNRNIITTSHPWLLFLPSMQVISKGRDQIYGFVLSSIPNTHAETMML